MAGFLVAVAAYWPAFRAGYVWDDDLHLTNNRNVTQRDGLARIWFAPKTNVQFQPVVFSSFWLEYRLWQSDPRGYHVVNFILHIVVSLLVWRAAYLLKVPGAALIAGVFALHPVHVESVAWITERKNVLSGVFYLLSALAYMRFCPIEEDRTPGTCRWRYYVLALLLFAAALLSKSVTCSLPAVLLLLMWWKRGRVGVRDIALLLPMFAAGVTMAAVTAWMARHQNRAIGEAWEMTFAQSLVVAGESLWFYIGRLVWPNPLTFVYPRWQIDARSIWSLLAPIAAIALIVALWLNRRHTGRGPLAALLIFGGSLFPALSFFKFYYMQYSFVADHFQYLASLGVIGLAIGSASVAASRHNGLSAKLLPVFAVIIVICCAGLTRLQASRYQNTITLWQDTIRKNPDAWLAQINLGNELLEQGRINHAIVHFRQALRTRQELSKAHHGLAVAFHHLENLNEATSHYERAVALDHDYAVAYSNFGNALLAQGRVGDAIESYRRAIEIRPNFAFDRFKLANVLAARGEMEQAIEHYREAIRIKPKYYEAHTNLGKALANQGEINQAKYHLREALRINPDFGPARAALEELQVWELKDDGADSTQ